MDPQAIAKQFLDHYYSTMSGNRMNLLSMYTDNSCMTYEGESYKGLKGISHKLESMGNSQFKYEFDEYDLQPGTSDGALLVMVIGGLKVDDNPPFKFSQTFQLAPNGNGGYYVHNDILRLIFVS